MSYRRNGKTTHDEQREWAEWKLNHSELLNRCGLPDGVLHSRRDWDYLLCYGYWCKDYYGKFVGHPYDFGLEELTPAQLDAFRELLTVVLNDEEKRGAMAWRWVCPPGA